MARLIVNEIFHSIQGESSWAGLPCVFIRLTGCHLRCCYCDSEYAFHEGRAMTLDEIIAQVEQLSGGRTRLAEVTGGEPLLQPDAGQLMTRLADLGWRVLVETSGACDIGLCDRRAIRIMDLKTPGSGQAGRNLWSNIDKLTPEDEIKFVLCDRADYDWAVGVIREHQLAQKVHAILLSVAARMEPTRQIAGCPGLSLADLAAWMLADGLGPKVRLQMQLHKVIWPPATRGV